MGEKDCFLLTNIKIDNKVYRINEYISLIQDPIRVNSTIVQTENIKDCYESNGVLFYRALQVALPCANIMVDKCDTGCGTLYECLKTWNTPLINYYGAKGNEIEEANTDLLITEETINLIKKVHNIVIKHNKVSNESRDNHKWEPSRWTYAFQQYVSACSSITIDNSILHIITGLESLLVKGDGQLSYKVSLNASLIVEDDLEKRKDIYKLVKKIYDFRSKVVHGEVKNVVKTLSESDIYTKYFRIREILSNVLIKLFDMSEDLVFEKIDETIFSSPSFKK